MRRLIPLVAALFLTACEEPVQQPEPEPRQERAAPSADTKPSDVEAKADPRPSETPPGSVASPGEPQVVLLDAGKEPREPLRTHLVKGQREQLTMTMEMKMAMDGAPPMGATPPMAIPVDAHVTDVMKNGDVRYEYTMGELALQPGATPEMRAALESALVGIKGAGGHVVISDRGVTREGTFKLPASADPMLAQMMGNMEESMEQLAVPLPVEAVGVGGRWQIKNPVSMNGLTIQRLVTYELVSRNGDELVLTMQIGGTIDKDKKATLPGLPPDVNIGSIEATMKGQGKMTWRLDRIGPQSSAAMATDMKVVVTEPQPMKIALTLDMKLNVASKLLP